MRERPVRPGDVPVDIDTLEGTFIGKVQQVPGGRQVFTAALAGLVATVFVIASATLGHTVPRDYQLKICPKTQPKGCKNGITQAALTKEPGVHTFLQAYGIVKSLVPPIIAFVIVMLALAVTLKPRRRQIWLVSAVVLAFLSLSSGGILFLIPAGYIGFGAYRAGKVEGPGGGLFGGRGRGVASTDGSIETSASESGGGSDNDADLAADGDSG